MPSVESAPENSIFFISDRTRRQTPEPVRDQLVWANRWCVVVGCLMSDDGPTTISIDAVRPSSPEMRQAFRGEIETPSRVLAVSTVSGRRILEHEVRDARTTVTIFVNHPTEPERIVVCAG